jgi:hypothetical protein
MSGDEQTFGNALHKIYGRSQKTADAALMICLSIGVLYAGARTGLKPQDPLKTVAVVFAPWTSAADVLSRAAASGARFVRFGGFPFIAVVIPDDATYPDRMFDDGAWLVVDSQNPGGCSAANVSARKNS